MHTSKKHKEKKLKQKLIIYLYPRHHFLCIYVSSISKLNPENIQGQVIMGLCDIDIEQFPYQMLLCLFTTRKLLVKIIIIEESRTQL